MNRNVKIGLYVAGGAAIAYFVVWPIASMALSRGNVDGDASGTTAASKRTKIAGVIPWAGDIMAKIRPSALLPSSTASNDRAGGSGSSRGTGSTANNATAGRNGGYTDPGYDAMAPNRYVSRQGDINVTARPPAQRA